MLDHGLQHLLHALTHDTVSCDSFSVKATSAECHCMFWYFTSSFFLDLSAFSSNRSSTSFFNSDQSPCQRRTRSPLGAPPRECCLHDVPSICSTWTNSVGRCRMSVALQDLSMPATTWALLRFSIWNDVSVDSATLSTTGYCRSRSFSSGNHRNSCNKISTCCPLVCHDVHTSMWEFSV